jgi:O-Antigen ligase
VEPLGTGISKMSQTQWMTQVLPPPKTGLGGPSVPSGPNTAVRERRRLKKVTSRLRTTAYIFVLIYVFVAFSQFHQLLTIVLGVDTHLLLVIGIPMILLVLASGALQSTLKWPATKLWIGFSLWMIISLPFSSLRSESLWVAITWLRVEVLILFVIASCVVTWKEVRTLMTVLACAAIVDVAAGRLFSGQLVGRLTLDTTSTTMSDPNDFAALLVLVLPCLLLVVLSASRPKFIRVIASVIFAYGLFLILITGSRGALVAISATTLFCLWKLKPGEKTIAVALIALAACAIPLVAPQRVMTRFATTLKLGDSPTDTGPDQHDVDSERAIGSGQERMYLLKQSILATLSHPVFGVGVGQFKDYEGRQAMERGERGSWHQTHNTLTQVSSEIGLPALTFFLSAVFVTYRMLDSVYSRSQRQPRTRRTQQIGRTAFCLLISLVGFCTVSLFLSLAYRFYLPALTGIAIALYRAANQEWKSGVAPIGYAPGLALPPIVG